jgi:hypothetical protein
LRHPALISNKTDLEIGKETLCSLNDSSVLRKSLRSTEKRSCGPTFTNVVNPWLFQPPVLQANIEKAFKWGVEKGCFELVAEILERSILSERVKDESLIEAANLISRRTRGAGYREMLPLIFKSGVSERAAALELWRLVQNNNIDAFSELLTITLGPTARETLQQILN